MNSKHYNEDRQRREDLIQKIGYGTTVKTVIIDRGHRNGPEIHEISDTGIITVYNERTKKLVTKLIARPGQIRRYYKENEIIPKNLLQIAKEHQRMAFNYAQTIKRLKSLFIIIYSQPMLTVDQKPEFYTKILFKTVDNLKVICYNKDSSREGIKK